MIYYRCLGGLENVTSSELHKKIEVLFPNIKGRSRLFGYDIELESEDLEFYINSYDEKEYKIDISTKKEEHLLLILSSLKQKLIELKGEFDLVYFKEDDEGHQISKDLIYFDNRPGLLPINGMTSSQ
ncbi:hypothetical protein ACE939_03075 [Aquimarina sp. W85]|uniref:hypothetical protein n=1 Tax=Aquimarina rhodophyticola TaxID=3342246 RepID=UPI00366C661A